MHNIIVLVYGRDGPQNGILPNCLYFSNEELHIIDLLSEGKSEAQVAEILKISQQQLRETIKRLKDRTLKTMSEDL